MDGAPLINAEISTPYTTLQKSTDGHTEAIVYSYTSKDRVFIGDPLHDLYVEISTDGSRRAPSGKLGCDIGPR